MAFLQVNGVDIKTPSVFEVGIQDVSAPDSGRDLSGLMFKNTITQKRTISLEWAYPTPQETAAIINAFMASEYFSVTYWDPTDASAQQTRTFYLGDRSSPIQQWTEDSKLYTSVAFNIIER